VNSLLHYFPSHGVALKSGAKVTIIFLLHNEITSFSMLFEFKDVILILKAFMNDDFMMFSIQELKHF